MIYYGFNDPICVITFSVDIVETTCFIVRVGWGVYVLELDGVHSYHLSSSLLE